MEDSFEIEVYVCSNSGCKVTSMNLSRMEQHCKRNWICRGAGCTPRKVKATVHRSFRPAAVVDARKTGVLDLVESRIPSGIGVPDCGFHVDPVGLEKRVQYILLHNNGKLLKEIFEYKQGWEVDPLYQRVTMHYGRLLEIGWGKKAPDELKSVWHLYNKFYNFVGGDDEEHTVILFKHNGFLEDPPVRSTIHLVQYIIRALADVFNMLKESLPPRGKYTRRCREAVNALGCNSGLLSVYDVLDKNVTYNDHRRKPETKDIREFAAMLADKIRWTLRAATLNPRTTTTTTV